MRIADAQTRERHKATLGHRVRRGRVEALGAVFFLAPSVGVSAASDCRSSSGSDKFHGETPFIDTLFGELFKHSELFEAEVSGCN